MNFLSTQLLVVNGVLVTNSRIAGEVADKMLKNCEFVENIKLWLTSMVQ